MKKIIYIVLAVALISGCAKKETNLDNNNDKEEKITMNYNYEKSFEIIQQVLNIEDKKVENILSAMERAGVQGAVSAQISEEDKSIAYITLKIESEDQKTYQLGMEKNFVVAYIKDIKTGEYIYAVIE